MSSSRKKRSSDNRTPTKKPSSKKGKKGGGKNEENKNNEELDEIDDQWSGPFLVYRCYYKYGEIGLFHYKTPDELRKAIKNELEEEEEEEEEEEDEDNNNTNNNNNNNKNKPPKDYDVDNDSLEKLCKIVIKKGGERVRHQRGWGWMAIGKGIPLITGFLATSNIPTNISRSDDLL